MLCPKCNTQNRDNAKFCKVCGYSFTSEDLAASQAVHATDAQSAVATQETVPAPANGINQVAPQDAQAVEVVVQPETVAPVKTPQESDITFPEDDISFAPTQILSPQEMVAFQARRWQQEARDTAGTDEPVGTDTARPHANEPISHADEQNASTSVALQTPDGHTVSSDAHTDVADMPTIMMSPNGDVAEGEPVQIPPPPPSEAQVAASGNDPSISTYAEQAAAPPASVTPPEPETVTPVGTDVSHPSSPPTDSAVAGEGHNESVPTDNVTEAQGAVNNASSTALAVGTLVAGRYEVMQVVHADEQEQVYQVADRQGYQQCWNCGSKENAKGDEFCIDCGAELLNASYLMHEYTATTGNQNNDAHVLQGTIANTFVEQGKTYVIEQQHAAQIAFPNGAHLLVASDSDAGDVRRSEPNEDSTLVLQFQRVHESQATPIGVFIIADGMGGHDNGQGASRMAINVIADKLVRELILPPLEAEKSGGLTASVTPMEEDALLGVFKGAIEEANNMLVQTNQHDKTDMGSTMTGFMIVGDSAFIINVGDSRTYMLREDTLYQLTNDHSLVAQLLAGGLIEPDDVYTHPQRSQIFRSLGDKMNVQVDDFKQQLLPGDILLSCSDGLWEMVRNPQITDILKNAHDPQMACAQLIEAANANGGEDNVSAVVVFVR